MLEGKAGATVQGMLVLLALLLPPLCLRGLLGFELANEIAPSDLRGALADLLASTLAFTMLALVGALSRRLAVVLVVLWVLLHYGNYEIVHALGAMASLDDAHYLGSGVFVAGSATAVSHPLLLAALLASSCAGCWIGLQKLRPHSALAGAGITLLLWAAYSAWPWSEALPLWRQANFVPRELGRLTSSAPLPRVAASRDPAEAMLERVPDLAANLAGEPRFPLPDQKHNVLLVILEGVTGAHLELLLKEHWPDGQGRMPAIDAIANENLSYSTFVSHQRRTNRGLYALLCGELPNLLRGVPKMSSYAIDGGRRCLPDILRDAGYATTYLQAAPLVFMLKDQFMPRIGFDSVHGGDWFEEAYSRTSWGVDDRAFFEQTVSMIEQLEAGDRPWFLSLLTVGTHHPYVVPDGFKPEMHNKFLRTVEYLDLALSAFMVRLGELGVLDDTLVLLTSDESHGHKSGRNEIAKILSQNWGFLIALTPERARGLVHEPFSQIDVPLSILDYLGLAGEGPHLMGRSVFRSYSEPRHLFFANGNTQMTGAFDPKGRIILCLNDFETCRVEVPQERRWFGGDRSRIALDRSEVDLLRDLAERSVRRRPAEQDRLEIDLQTRRFEVVDDRVARMVHGGQFIALETYEWVEVEIDVTVRASKKLSAADGEVVLTPVLRSHQSKKLYRGRFPLTTGDRLRLTYTYAPGEPVTGLQSQLMARSPHGQAVELEFERARITIMRSGIPEAVGIHVKLQEIDEG